MTREEIELDYDIEDGIIRSPGKFEGEPIYVPYFWQLGLEGFADDDDGDEFVFDLGPEELQMWPELGDGRRLTLSEDSSGFVYSVLELL